MFIIVKYGNNESLLCNPSCAVVNLLNSIKKRAGYGNTGLILDLSDETGKLYFLHTCSHNAGVTYFLRASVAAKPTDYYNPHVPIRVLATSVLFDLHLISALYAGTGSLLT